MSDPYLAVSQIANDPAMRERVTACAAQQEHLGLPIEGHPVTWTDSQRYVWASSPGWGEKWAYALATHPDDPDYLPGRDAAVITDDDILATVQALATSARESAG